VKTIIETSNAPAAIGPYSQAISAGGMLFCSGQIALIPDSEKLVLGDVGAQAEQVLKNLGAVLQAGGASFDSVIKTTIFLKDLNDFDAVNAVYQRFFQKALPARACVEVSRLPKDVDVEIDAIALVESAPTPSK